MSTSMIPEIGSLAFWRIVDVPFETCVAAFDGWLPTINGGELRIGGSQLLGPIEHDRELGTHRIQVRLARGAMYPMLRTRDALLGSGSPSPYLNHQRAEQSRKVRA